jgi:hypothetical protein
MLAIGAILVSGGYALIIGVFALVALFTGSPLFFRLWTLVFPTLGLVLALFARQSIRSSEGVLTGMLLTNLAWWLSVLFGIGYTAYYFGTYMAITASAESFTQQWFNKIREGKITEAFLDTQEPARRKYENPSDSQAMYLRYGMTVGRRRGLLTLFRDQEFVRIIQQGGTSAELKSIGVRGWDHDKGSYEVVQDCQLITPEGDFHLQVALRRSEGKDLEKPDWYIVTQQPQSTGFVGRPNLTDLGQTLEAWSRQSKAFAADWVRKRNAGDSELEFLDTLPASERASVERSSIARMAADAMSAAGIAAGALNPLLALPEFWCLSHSERRPTLYLPGYADYAAGKFIDTKQMECAPKNRKDIIDFVTGYFRQPALLTMQPLENKGRPMVADKESGVVRIRHDVDLGIFPKGRDARTTPEFTCDAAVWLESDRGPLTPNRKPAWRVVELQILRGVKPAVDPMAAAGGG